MVKGGVLVNTVFYDANYQRIGEKVTHDFGKAIPVPVGAMFSVSFLTTVPEEEWTVITDEEAKHLPPSSAGYVERDTNPGRF
jgi:hypothetical protein